MKNIYTVPAGTAFADAIAATLLECHGRVPEALAEVAILVPTRRAVRALEEGFRRQAGERALLLPAIRAIGDADEDELAVALVGESEAGAELAPAIAPLRRQLLLARAIFGIMHDFTNIVCTVSVLISYCRNYSNSA